MSNECTITRDPSGRQVANGNCNLDLQRVLDSGGFAALPPAVRWELTVALERNGDDFAFATQVRGLLSDFQRLGSDDLGADERTEMARQIAAHPTSDTIRRMRSLAKDPDFLSMGSNAGVREIRDTVGAEPPTVAELFAGAHLQSPPRSAPGALLALEGGLELAEPLVDLLGAGEALECAIGAVAVSAAEIAAGAIAIYEVWEGIAAASEAGREWGRRIAHGEGFAAAMAWRMAGHTTPAEIPEEIGDHPEAVRAFQSGIDDAERNWARLEPRERAVLTATAGDGDSIRELFRRVRERTVRGG